MSPYPIHSIDEAPEEPRSALQGLQQTLGLVPNLAAMMAESPILINSFVGAFRTFHAGSFTGPEKQVLLLTNAVANTCPWAAAFHSTMALKEGVMAEDVEAVRERRLPQDPRCAGSSNFTRTLVATRGHVDQAEVAAFASAGFRRDQALEVIAGLAVSVLDNYAGNVTTPVLEAMFRPQAWDAQGYPR